MIIRYVRSIAAGAIATLGLLALMQSLTAMDPVQASERRDRHTLTLAVVRDDSRVVRNEAPPPLPPQPVPETRVDPGIDPSAIPVTIGRPDAIPPELGPFSGPAAQVHDGPLVAVLRVEPDYPARAEQFGLEGWVLVEFDVTAAGTVDNVAVIEASDRLFEAAAKRAARGFRYKPRIVDGQPLPSRGLRYRFRFEMPRG